ncbi:phosphotransferase [Paenibacillus sp. CAU 1782]
MEISLAEHQVAEWAAANSVRLSLDPSRIQASYIYNPGGFGNASFTLTDGLTWLHIKLAPPGYAERLRKWASVSGYLAEHYSAPGLVCLIESEVVPGYPYGLAFQYINHAVPLSQSRNPETPLHGILETAAKLHRDERLRELLPNTETRTYAEAFQDEYIARFEADLETIQSSREMISDFVSNETIAWFGDEIRRLDESVSQSTAFQFPAADVVHNDLNGNNILTLDDGSFRIIDWDDLSGHGDAAMDYSVLLWPFIQHPSWPIWREKALALAGAAAFERLELYFRAKLLDDVIDVLADYIEAEQVPEHREEARRKSKSVHLSAYPQYLAQYGPGE